MFGMMLAGLSGSPVLNWADIAGSFDASNSDVVMPFSETITVTFTNPGMGGAIYYVKNGGAPVQYSIPFAITAGDLLHFEAQTKGTWTSVISVYRATSILIDTFNVTLS